MDLKRTETLEFLIEDGECEQAYRLTFGACSGYQKSLFDRYRDRAFGLVADEYAPVEREEASAEGEEAKPVVALSSRLRYFETRDSLQPFARDMADSKLNAMIFHAAAMVSLRKVEVKAGDDWIIGKLPDFWYDMSTAVEQLSEDLANALTMKTFIVNPPRLFGFVSDGPDEKKDLRMIVPKSVS